VYGYSPFQEDQVHFAFNHQAARIARYLLGEDENRSTYGFGVFPDPGPLLINMFDM